MQTINSWIRCLSSCGYLSYFKLIHDYLEIATAPNVNGNFKCTTYIITIHSNLIFNSN